MSTANDLLDSIRIVAEQISKKSSCQVVNGLVTSVSNNKVTMTINGKSNSVFYYGGTPTINQTYRVFIPQDNMSNAFIIVPGEGSGGGGTDTNAVHYTADSGKTDNQKTQARTNISAMKEVTVTTADNGKVLGVVNGIWQKAESSTYTLPVATSSVLGGVMPTAKTSAMTQGVGVDASGGLWTAPSGGGGGNVFIVTFSYNFSTEEWESDKTYAEINAACQNGDFIVGISPLGIPLQIDTRYNTTQFAFYGVYRNAGGGTPSASTYLEVKGYSVTADNTVVDISDPPSCVYLSFTYIYFYTENGALGCNLTNTQIYNRWFEGGYEAYATDGDNTCNISLNGEPTATKASFCGMYTDSSGNFVLENIVLENDVATRTTKTIT